MFVNKSTYTVCHTQKGVLLIEVLISMTLSIFFVYVMLQALASAYLKNEETQVAVRIYTDLYQAMDMLSYDVRMAGYKGCGGRSKSVVVASQIEGNFEANNMDPNDFLFINTGTPDKSSQTWTYEACSFWSVKPYSAQISSHDTHPTDQTSTLYVDDLNFFVEHDIRNALLMITSCEFALLVKPSDVDESTGAIHLQDFSEHDRLTQAKGPIELLVVRKVSYTLERDPLTVSLYSQVMNSAGDYSNKVKIATVNQNSEEVAKIRRYLIIAAHQVHRLGADNVQYSNEGDDLQHDIYVTLRILSNYFIGKDRDAIVGQAFNHRGEISNYFMLLTEFITSFRNY